MVSISGQYDNSMNSDMTGTSQSGPEKSTVLTDWFNFNGDFSWQIGQHSVQASGSTSLRHTTSKREGFSPINANESRARVSGNVKLPLGFSASSTMTVYFRRGYGLKELNTTDPIWNISLAYKPSKLPFTFRVEGYDMLHRLTNVNYAINAQGRTITYTNSLPQYIMFYVQYRFTKQPKKKSQE